MEAPSGAPSPTPSESSTAALSGACSAGAAAPAVAVPLLVPCGGRDLAPAGCEESEAQPREPAVPAPAPAEPAAPRRASGASGGAHHARGGSGGSRAHARAAGRGQAEVHAGHGWQAGWAPAGAQRGHAQSAGDAWAQADAAGWAAGPVFSSRTLALSGFPPAVDDAHVLDVARRYGAVRAVHTEGRQMGVILVSFYDVRNAEAAVAGLAAGGWPEAGAWLSVTLVPPPEHAPGLENQGCLVLQGWPSAGSEAGQAELAALLTNFGDLRALRPAPNAPALQFAEFCDTRCAAAALDALNCGTPLRPGLPRMQAEFGHMPPTRAASGVVPASAAAAVQAAHPVAWAGASAPVIHHHPSLMPHHGVMPGSPGSYPAPGAGWHGQEVHSLGPGEVFMGSDGLLYRTSGGAPFGYGGHRYGGDVMAPRSPAAAASRPGRRAANRSRGGSSDDSDLSSPPGGSTGGSGASGGPRRASGPPSAAAIAAAARDAESAARDAARFAFSASEASGPEARTTLMLRNIPNKCTRSGLLASLEAGGIAVAAVDFVYLPVDFKHKCNLGYAFLNCTSAAATRALHDAFHGRPWPEFRSRKVCAVTYARLQGRTALAAHFRAARFPAECDDALPLLLHHDDVDGAPPRAEVIGVRVPPQGGGAPPSASSGAGRRATPPASAAPVGMAEEDVVPAAPLSDGADVASLSLSEDAGSGAEAEQAEPAAAQEPASSLSGFAGGR